VAEKDGHEHTSDLVEQIVDMNKGKYLDDTLKNPKPTDFCIGVAGYPEKHFEAPNMETDLANLKLKIDAGGEYIVTQMFFDNAKYFKFVDDCRSIGIDVPIIPGIKPVTAASDIDLLPQTFSIDLPNELYREIKKCGNDDEVREAGIEWATEQAKGLIAGGVPGIHFYTLGRSDNVARIVKAAY
jgi:methylenetetrahydrofolate reductase (NADPH)